ncbi:hypothetical protein ABG79_02019 [Caloramator mitchellensis]|uniref:Uncharacterized protein n=1 Tax=Caloramator mitchellensis TaxID=908809 RepID=A0A0R3K011_CALMK|nr:hypothetical protein [Caloramator mitchellensis]KRQ86178.1 hypothetical protein ABG79_02019 [Caloramator mitchellensis]
MKKGIFAVILIAILGTIIIGAYFMGILTAVFSTGAPKFLGIIIGLIAFSIIGALIYVALERIKEIKEGKEDDISKY